jgi:hypothetical protein
MNPTNVGIVILLALVLVSEVQMWKRKAQMSKKSVKESRWV